MRVRWTTDAADDLERLCDYVARDRPETARRMALDIIRSVDALDTFPNRGRLGRVEGTRELVLAPNPRAVVNSMIAVFHAIRVIRRNPAFSALIVVILGIGVGATTAAMNVATAVLWNPLPVTDDPNLVRISKTLPVGSTNVPFTPAETIAWGESSRTMDAVAGVQYDGAWPWPAQFDNRALVVTGATVSGNFFHVLGVQPIVGRVLSDDDARQGAEDVVVIGYGLWRREFGGIPGIVGQQIRLNGRMATIAGVAPRGFEYPKGADVWQPLLLTPESTNEGWFTLIARVKHGISLAQVREESTVLLERLRSVARAHSPENVRTSVIAFRDAIVGDVRPVLAMFVAAAMLLFAVGCINVVNLLLVRGTAREREVSVCAALGATRFWLMKQMAIEALVFAVSGGVLGVLIAFWLQRALVALAPASIPRLEQIAFDGRTLAVASIGATLGASLAAVGPALWTIRRSLFSQLRTPSEHEPGGIRAQISRQVLIGSQLAFALLVAVAATLLIRSLQELQALDLGFPANRLTVVHVPLVGRTYDDAARRQQLFDQLVSQLEASPDVEAATPVLLRPFTGTEGWDATFTREGQGRDEAAANPGVHLEAVRENYFSTMGIRIAQGRGFAESDAKGTLPVTIIGESMARDLWPGSIPLGRRIKFGGFDSPAPWMTVVGVVSDLRYRDLKSPPPAIYVPSRQSSFPARFLIVRSRVDDAPVLSTVQRTLNEIDPAEPVPEATPVSSLLAGELAGPRFHMLALSLFAAIAVFLAGVGVFGVLGAFVAQRSREVGLRIALGATRADVRRLVLANVGKPAALGLCVGTLVAFAVTPWLQPLLFRVSTFDVQAFAVGWVMLLLTSLVAAIIPLRRAARVDPVMLLRSE